MAAESRFADAVRAINNLAKVRKDSPSLIDVKGLGRPKEYHLGAPGAESQRFSARCICSFHCSWLAAHFLPSLWRFVLSAASCPAVMSCWLRSRTPSRWASPGSWALPVLVASLSLPMLAHRCSKSGRSAFGGAFAQP